MRKTRECEEVVLLDGTTYLFAGTFGAISGLRAYGRDPAMVYDDLTSGMLCPELILNTLKCTLEKVDGKEPANHDEECIKFIEAAGLQESAFIARLMLNNAMIGSVKKKRIRLEERNQAIKKKSQNFLSKNSTKLGFCLGVVALISILLACMNLSA